MVIQGTEVARAEVYLGICCCRYSSFGRHFSNRQLLYAIANVLEQYMRPYDCIVDFSCGANDFVPIVKDVCFANGYEVRQFR